jgi:sRNA-binding protein
VLGSYSSRRMYVAALAAGGARYDLDGQPYDEVSTEHAETARAWLDAIDAMQTQLTAEVLTAFNAKREAQRAKARAEREDARAKDAAEFVAKRRAAGAVAEKPKSPAPYYDPHRGDGLAGLKAAAQPRRQMMGAR